MKKKLFTYLFTLLTLTVFGQKTIENPNYGLSTLPGSITKVEILENETILYFHLKTTPNSSYSIPKKTYIQGLNSPNKLFITKAKGTKISKHEVIPESGEKEYALYFPKIEKNVKTIEFGEANDGGTWFVFDIVIEEDKNSITPNELLGNWFKTDGSNLYTYSFNAKNVIINKELWNYTSVKSKKNKYTLVLNNNGEEKNIKATLEKDGSLCIKEDKNKKEIYSKNNTNSTNYHPKNNEGLKTPDFKLGIATYKGIIKNYTPRIGIKTGMVYVNNSFTGEQESHLIKIAENGTFSIELPITHPQFVFSRAFHNNQYIFIAPGKETFHVIDGHKSFFMGDLAQINTDLEKMKNIRISGATPKIRKNILQIKPLDFKAIILKQQTEALQKIEELNKTTFISKKALELKKLSLEYETLSEVLSYDMYDSYAKRNLNPEELKNLENQTIDENYLAEITPNILNNTKAIMTEGYTYFINYFSHLALFKDYTNTRVTTNDVIAYLQEQHVEIPKEQMEAIQANKLINTPEKQKKQDAFDKKYGARMKTFYKENLAAIQKLQKEKPNENTYQYLKEKLKKEGKLSPLDEEMLIASNNITTNQEKLAIKAFQEKHGEALQNFITKNSTAYTHLSTIKYYKSRMDKMKEVIKIDTSFVFDIITLRNSTRKLTTELIPYKDSEITNIKKEITNKNIANYLDIANNKTIATLEANKTKTGYNVNKVEKTEGDELFNSMIAKFKGKVIYVDFWATWCGPCMSGIKRIAPLKEKMKNDEVVFLYISAPSSPEKTWENTIPNIKGEHYRVSKDEWNYLTDKFNIRGIPHYALVNKKGELVHSKLGHKTNNQIEKLLKTELNK